MNRGERTKQDIAGALLALAEEKPYAAITASDIIARSGVSRNTFYYHFRDKADLISWIYWNAPKEAVSASPEGVFVNQSRSQQRLEFFHQNWALLSSAFFDRSQNGLSEVSAQSNILDFTRIIKRYLGSRELDPAVIDLIARYCTYGCVQAGLDCITRSNPLPYDQAAAVFAALLETGLRATLDALASPRETS